jgi:hypothetical protein
MGIGKDGFKADLTTSRTRHGGWLIATTVANSATGHGASSNEENEKSVAFSECLLREIAPLTLGPEGHHGGATFWAGATKVWS